MTSRGKCQVRIAVIAGVWLLSGAGPGSDGVRRAQADNWLKRMVEAQRALEAAADSTPQPDRGDRDEAKQRGPEPPPPSDDLADNAINVSAAGTVEMHVANASLATVLHVLSAESHRNIIATPGVTGTVTAHLYNVTFEEALDAVLVANQAGYREVGNFIYVYTNDELAKLAERESPPVSRVFSLFYISARDASAIVTPMLSQGGTAVAAPEPDKGLSSAKEEGGGEASARQSYLVVRDRPDVLERVAATLRELDVRPTQVLVEATILGVTLSDENSLGVDFTVVGGVDLELLGSTSTAVTNLNVGELPTDRFEKFNSNITTDFTGTVPDGGMTIGVIKDHVGVFVRALESISDAMVLANPKVLALNKQKAQVIVGRRDGYLTTTVTETQAIQTVEFLETGTQLIFRPFIGDDGYVRMELHPEDSVGTVAGGLPSEQTTEVTTNVMVRDGQTILIGGLFREVNSDGRSQIPVLGDLPVVGAAFRGRNDRTIRQEVIILLTVHIVKDQDRYAQAGEAARQDSERIRVGMRRHLMWTGRERLAQAHYRKALEQYTAGDLDKAQWNVRLALHNNPELLAAIQLKEEILGRRSWDDDGSMIRGFIQALIAEEQGVVQPEFDRPAPPFTPPAALYGPTPTEKREANDGQ